MDYPHTKFRISADIAEFIKLSGFSPATVKLFFALIFLQDQTGEGWPAIDEVYEPKDHFVTVAHLRQLGFPSDTRSSRFLRKPVAELAAFPEFFDHLAIGPTGRYLTWRFSENFFDAMGDMEVYGLIDANEIALCQGKFGGALLAQIPLHRKKRMPEFRLVGPNKGYDAQPGDVLPNLIHSQIQRHLGPLLQKWADETKITFAVLLGCASCVTYRLHIAAGLELDSASPVSKLADHIEQSGLVVPVLADEYRYASLPFCVVDAVFSIGVRYASTQKVVSNLCEYTGWARFAPTREGRGEGEQRLTDLTAFFDTLGIDGMADTVFQNRQRTSSRSGILKSEAVLLYCRALTEAGINTFADLDLDRCEYAEAMILGLPGQSSGIAFDYFMMLAGDDNLIKPDRMVQRYVANALKLDAIPQPRQAAILVRLAAKVLRKRGRQWTPLSLDHAIWRFQSAKASAQD